MKRKRGGLMILLGILLVAAALILTAYNFSDDRRASRSASDALSQLLSVIPEAELQNQQIYDPAETSLDKLSDHGDEVIPDYILDPEKELVTEKVNELSYVGIIEFPTLRLTLPVVGELTNPALASAPCRYSGSPYTDDLVIAGHNYRSHFGRLDRLKPGDRVYFTDMDGNRFEYTTVLTENIHGTDVTGMLDGGWDLSLFTCTMSGSYRTTVRLDKTENN